MQDKKLNQIKLKVNDIYMKDEKKTTNFVPSNDDDVVNKAYLDTKRSKRECQISYIQKDYNEVNLHNNKQSVEEFLTEGAMRMTFQILHGKGLSDNCDNAVEMTKDFVLIGNINDWSRPDLEELNVDGNVLQWLHS